MSELTRNQKAAEYAVLRLTHQIKQCAADVAAFLTHVQEHNLQEALRWKGDDALAAEWASGQLRQAREELGEIHQGAYTTDAIRALDSHRSRVEQLLLGGGELSMSSGGPCNMAARLSEIEGNRRAYKALTAVYRSVRNFEATL